MFPASLFLNGQEIPLVTKRNRRARRIVLRFCPAGQAVTLVYPYRTPAAKALAFLTSKETWLAQQVAALPERIPFLPGQVIPVLGRPLSIQHIHQARGLPAIADGQLVVPCLPEFLHRRVSDFLKALLKEETTRLATHKAAVLGLSFQRLGIRPMVSRWGSCSHDGNLAFARNLVFAPYEVMDYIVAHEVAHLKEMNHSRRFWKIVASLCPEYKQHNAWLRNYGHTLHCYG